MSAQKPIEDAAITNEYLDNGCPIIQGAGKGAPALVACFVPVAMRMAISLDFSPPVFLFSLAASLACGALVGAGIAKYAKDRARGKAIIAKQMKLGRLFAYEMADTEISGRPEAMRLNEEIYALVTHMNFNAPRLPQPAKKPVHGVGHSF